MLDGRMSQVSVRTMAGQQRGSGRRLSDAALLVRNRNHGGRHVPCTPFTHLRPEQSRFSHLFVRKIEILS